MGIGLINLMTQETVLSFSKFLAVDCDTFWEKLSEGLNFREWFSGDDERKSTFLMSSTF